MAARRALSAHRLHRCPGHARPKSSTFLQQARGRAMNQRPVHAAHQDAARPRPSSPPSAYNLQPSPRPGLIERLCCSNHRAMACSLAYGSYLFNTPQKSARQSHYSSNIRAHIGWHSAGHTARREIHARHDIQVPRNWSQTLASARWPHPFAGTILKCKIHRPESVPTASRPAATLPITGVQCEIVRH